MQDDVQRDARQRMEKTIGSLKDSLSKVRTGRAQPSLLDHLRVDYYGSEVPIQQVATIAVADSRTLAITPWEKTMVSVIEKAIMNSDLGLNPATAGTVIRVPLPALTEERRRELVKLVRQEGEHARVAIRNIRRDSLASFKDMVKEKLLTEDDERREAEQVQKLTDEYVHRIEELLQSKEAELMEV